MNEGGAWAVPSPTKSQPALYAVIHIPSRVKMYNTMIGRSVGRNGLCHRGLFGSPAAGASGGSGGGVCRVENVVSVPRSRLFEPENDTADLLYRTGIKAC